MNPVKWLRAAGVIVVFLLGVLTGIILEEPATNAQPPSFGPDDVKSVPESFLRGGDRSYSALQEIRGLLEEQTKHLQEISRNTAETSATLKSVAQ